MNEKKAYKPGSTRDDGDRAEDRAGDFLKQNGVRILERNFRCRTGEIDIIGSDDGIYVFFEVKYRRNGSSGRPFEAVGFAKQRKICRAADFYRMKMGLSEDAGFRFDVISILGDDISWYKNAFYYTGG